MPAAHFFAIASLAFGTAAVGQQAATPPPQQQQPINVTGEKPAPPQQKLVCKNESTGSLIPKRVCMTAAEWKKAEDNASGQMQEMRDWQRIRCSYGTNC